MGPAIRRITGSRRVLVEVCKLNTRTTGGCFRPRPIGEESPRTHGRVVQFYGGRGAELAASPERYTGHPFGFSRSGA